MKATIQLSIAYTYKDEWSKGKFQNVNSFIPSCGIGEGTQHKLAVLLLMDEVVDLFINKKNSQHCLYHGKPYGAIFNVALVMSFNPSFEHLLIFYGCPVVSSVGHQANQDSSCKIFSFVVLVAILMKTWCHWSHNERTKSYWPQRLCAFLSVVSSKLPCHPNPTWFICLSCGLHSVFVHSSHCLANCAGKFWFSLLQI